ncbi:MAG: acyltransferase family protein [Terriglobales bacterium]
MSTTTFVPAGMETNLRCNSTALSQRLAGRIPSLDGLRAVAVLLVIFNHLGVPHAPEGRGVLTFFVLSGFLITWTLLRESDSCGDVSIRNFYIRRGLRIFPAFYIFWVLHFAITWLMQGRPSASAWADYAAAFFYVRNYRRAMSVHPHQYFGHTWALSIEEQFYLLWPWLLRFFQKDLRRLSFVLIGIIAAVDFYRIILFFEFHVSRAWLNFSFDSRVDHLLVGCLLAVLLKRDIMQEFWAFITSRVWISLLVFGLIVASIALDGRYGLAYKFGVGFVVDPLLTAVLLVQVIVFANTRVWGWLNWSLTRFVGRISYSMFLYQAVTNYWATHLLKNHSRSVVVAAALSLAVLLGSASYYLIELRFLRLKTKFIRGGRKVLQSSPAELYSRLQPEESSVSA